MAATRNKASEDLCATFDALPVVVRRALQTTIRNWGSADAQKCLDASYSPMALAGMIKSMDVQQAMSEGGYEQNPSHMG